MFYVDKFAIVEKMWISFMFYISKTWPSYQQFFSKKEAGKKNSFGYRQRIGVISLTLAID